MENKPIKQVLDDGSQEWYLNGVLHREDGPAVKHPSGYHAYMQYGELHRVDGPARAYGLTTTSNGGLMASYTVRTDPPSPPQTATKNGISTECKSQKRILTRCKTINSCLKMDDKPIKKTYGNGGEEWTLNGKLHHEYGPARIWPDGYQEWCIHGEFHREDGPARIWPDGDHEWWINGVQISEADFNALRNHALLFPRNA
jgi:hypothetical protein